MKKRKIPLNKRQLIFRRILIVLVIFFIIEGIIMYSQELKNSIPDRINIQLNEEERVYGLSFFSTSVEKEDIQAVSVNHEPLEKDKINMDYGEEFTIASDTSGTATITYRLFGIFDWKKTEVNFRERPKIVPLGATVGIDIKTDGILVLGTGKVQDDNGRYVEPAANIIRSGDYIKKLNDKDISTIDDFLREIDYAGDEIILTVFRNGENIQLKLPTIIDYSGKRRAGIWVRDSTQGIGTLTFVTQDGSFGALGHSITDIDTGLPMKLDSGQLYPVKVVDIHKGEDGAPGELCGTLFRSKEKQLGSIVSNTDVGIYGKIDQKYINFSEEQYYEIGFKQEAKIGKAQILCQLKDNSQKEITQGELYDIEILKLDYNNNSKNKGMIIRITDEKLLEQTNGIVQGMSGSPIIQNGRIIGAVTHVFINDCTKGYGIFIENMLEQ